MALEVFASGKTKLDLELTARIEKRTQKLIKNMHGYRTTRQVLDMFQDCGNPLVDQPRY